MDKIPKKITPCNISNSICELRFNSSIPGDAIFGIIYTAFREEFSVVEKLPILELPASVREHDPALEFVGQYRIKSEKFLIQIGPKMVSLSVVGDYVGWLVFKEKLVEIFNKIESLGVYSYDQVTRLGLRYINIYPEMDILKNSRVTLKLDEDDLLNNSINLFVEIPSDKATMQLRVVNSASMTTNDNKVISGSIIDIDVALDPRDFDSYEQMTEYAHDAEKKLFFSTLSKEYISTLNPEY